MNWTTETPTKPGVYWALWPSGITTVVRIAEMPSGTLLALDEDEDDHEHPEDMGAELWYGPIAPPPLPAMPDPA